MKKYLLLPLSLFAKDPSIPPETIDKELKTAEVQFAEAKKMFNPWYTGPLITPSASMMPPGVGNIQPYLFFTDNYAAYNQNRKTVSQPNEFTLNPLAVVQAGLTPSVDFILNAQGVESWKSGTSGGGFSDLVLTLGFLIYHQTLYVPQFKFSIQQSFPTGNYQNLSSNGLNLSATGAGAYQTTFCFGTSKILFWSYDHPINARLFVGYTLSTPITVHNFNAYGGGFGTNGRVHPGNSLAVDFGFEYSVTQPWVLAIDVVYKYTNQTTFSGNPGTIGGAPASVGGGSSDNLSLAPAIEYNWNENLGVIAGAWFSVYGRNTSAFASGVFSVVYTFNFN